jgi:enediyne biosynthesis protein E4
MKKVNSIISIIFLIACVSGSEARAQGGWIFDLNPLNDITAYTTYYPYAGCSFAELNGDGLIDIYAAPRSVFFNNGDGTFSAAAPLGYMELNATSGSSIADLDNDGDNDIIVAGVPTKVFFNDGDGTFRDSTIRVPDVVGYGSWGVAIGDYNKDRLPDFIFAHARGFHAPYPDAACKLFVQQPGGFMPSLVGGYPFTIGLDAYTNPYWSDYDLDGDMDLFIASGPTMGTPDYDYCYKNMKVETGADTFMEMTTELFATQLQSGQCYNFIDIDNDGDFDLCLTNYFGAPTRMYRNDAGVYVQITTPFTTNTTNIANCWGDYDNDGDLDVIITNDNQVTKYFRNDGGTVFTYLSDGFTTPTATNGITNGDYDNDGDLDVFTNGVGNNGNTSSVGLFINDAVAEGNTFVNFTLVGVVSSRSAIGAIVKIKATIGGTPVWQIREVNAQNSFQGQNDLRVHFGLRDAATIDSMIIIWPSGNIEYYQHIAPGFFYQYTEGAGATTLSVSRVGNGDMVSVFPNPACDILQVDVPDTGGDRVHYRLTDALGRTMKQGNSVTAKFVIDVADLPEGVYSLSLNTASYSLTRQVLKR